MILHELLRLWEIGHASFEAGWSVTCAPKGEGHFMKPAEPSFIRTIITTISITNYFGLQSNTSETRSERTQVMMGFRIHDIRATAEQQATRMKMASHLTEHDFTNQK